MIADVMYKPRLRHVEVFPIREDNGMAIALRDPSGLSDAMLSMSVPALQLLALMDGTHTVSDIREAFHVAVGQSVSVETVEQLVEYLESARFLEGPRFESYYASLLGEYRSRGVRDMPRAAELGISDGSGCQFEEILGDAERVSLAGPIRGLIAPHLDYPRGRPCYADAYATLRDRTAPDRVVILGTNHVGRSTSVVTTANDFDTPLGRTATDRAFIERLEHACGDLRRYELDHAREHSVELQVAFVQHLFGADRVAIVPVLCPDPCGPTRTAPFDGNGVDLKDFAQALRSLIEEPDAGDTLIIAGADMSHVGAGFGDERSLDEGFLAEVHARDRAALASMEINDPAAFVRSIANESNPTRVCSAGCMFVIRVVLADATAHVLRYHQAVDQEGQGCVTCAAVAFV